MEQVTVSMPLARFKQLESLEELVRRMRESPMQSSYVSLYVFFDRFNQYPLYIFPDRETMLKKLIEEKQQAIDERDKTIAKVRAYEDKTGNKVW